MIEPREEAVAAAASVLATAPTVEPSGLGAACWHGTAREVLIAALPLVGVQRHEDVARVLYECERKRAEHCQHVMQAASGRECPGAAMEPWEECKETFLSDARAVLALPHTGQAGEGREAIRQRIAAGHWFNAFTSDEQVGAVERGAFLDEIVDALSAAPPPPVAESETLACTGCGSTMTDDELRVLQKYTMVRACCSDRKMRPIVAEKRPEVK